VSVRGRERGQLRQTLLLRPAVLTRYATLCLGDDDPLSHAQKAKFLP